MNDTRFSVSKKIVSWLVIVLEIFLSLVVLVLAGRSAVYEPSAIATFSILSVALISTLAGFISLTSPRTSSRFLLWASPLVVIGSFRLYEGFGLATILMLLVVVMPGLFWHTTSRYNWPLPLTASSHPSIRSRFLCAFMLLTILAVSSIFLSFFLPFWPPIGDCEGRPLLNDFGKPANTDFTAKILFVGPQSFENWSLWSIARVEERFSDGPWSVGGLVILRSFFHATDRQQRFFIEGGKDLGIFTRFLPVIKRVECGHFSRMSDAIVSLRTLREGPPDAGVRIIGQVLTTRWKNPVPSPGVEVLIKGPEGTRLITTDRQGVYDMSDLPFGRYVVELSRTHRNVGCFLNLQKVPVDGCNLFLDE